MKFFAKVTILFSIIANALCAPIAEFAQSQPDVSPREITAKVSKSPSDHPFLRHKRNVNCSFPDYLPQLVQELNTFLPNASVFIGLPQQQAPATIPANQPKLGDCPRPTGSWWPGDIEGLKSTCPWVYGKIDLGDMFYPSSILSVECLCETCIHSNSLSCNKLRTEVTVFKIDACPGGLAVMTAVKMHVTTACFCAGASKSTATTPAPTE